MTLTAVLSSPPRQFHPAVVEPSLVDLFERIGVAMTFDADDEIYVQDDQTDLVYHVLAGAVRSARLLSDGRRQVGGFYYSGDIFGLETAPLRRASAEALAPTKVLAVRRSALMHYGDLGQRLESMLWRATGEELAQVRDHLLLVARKRAIERIAGFLDDIAQRLTGDWVDLPMARQDIADYLGLTVETVSRTLTHLQAKGIVQFDGCRRFRIRAPSRLAALVEG
ncbi:helix-turn-helix domain-containing protein [Caulobacter sp.]|uniref:helix-turn-helix domain-containing protein n=1 Tax=Caulobacter sp. TaxID=78 RepID=UPI002B48CE14|nr:helix-turn-helix domain-containing protein [Caulobacter sp.]HJV43083.1 helix-turn-helix domain-containing protein [Caulobacter sp.]